MPEQYDFIEEDDQKPLVIDMGFTVTGATSITFFVKKKDGTTATWAAAISGTTAFTYTLVAADLPLGSAGNWTLQVRFTLSGGAKSGEKLVILRVGKKLS